MQLWRKTHGAALGMSFADESRSSSTPYGVEKEPDDALSLSEAGGSKVLGRKPLTRGLSGHPHNPAKLALAMVRG